MRPAAARRQKTFVLLLKPGAHKVAVVGEATALELEEAGRAVSVPSIPPAPAVFQKDLVPISLLTPDSLELHTQLWGCS